MPTNYVDEINKFINLTIKKKESELVILKFPTKKTPVPKNGFFMDFTNHSKKN